MLSISPRVTNGSARNTKNGMAVIYPGIDKAPFIGEYQCRCILTEADYAVEEEGAKVEEETGSL